MTRTLLGQNIIVLLATMLFALVLSLSLVAVFVIRPEAQRAADSTWGLAEVLAFSVDRMDVQERIELLQLIDRQSHINVKVSSEPPEVGGSPTSLAGRFLLNELRQKNHESELENWSVGEDGLFWMRIPGSDPTIWMSFRTLQVSDPAKVIGAIFAVTLLTSVIGGLILHRHLARPLKRLAQEVEKAELGTGLPIMDESGPHEVAAVSRALNKMSETMRQAEQDRSVMLAGVSHDLRTPLTKLRLSLAMLQGADQELLTSADRQVARIEMMLEQFLEYARGFAEEPLQEADLCKVIDLAIANSAVAGKVRITCPRGAIAYVKKTAILRAMTNLVTNAAHHGRPPVEIVVETSPTTVTISVIDAGPGLGPDEAAALMRPFARGDTARTREGTGLGLAIAHQAALAHGGALTCNRSKAGFAVSLSLPRG